MVKIKEKKIDGKKILVTGGAGFIGSHLVERLIKLGSSVTIYDNLLRGEESLRNLKEIFEHSKPEIIVADVLDFEKVKEQVNGKDIIFHLAALPSHRLALRQPRDYALVDLIGTVNILEAARLTEPTPKIVFASSNKVYGKQQIPFKEDMVPIPEGPYGQSKLSSEEFCRQYATYYGMDIPVIRYHHVVGPRCQPDLVLSIFTERVINNLPPIIHGHFEKEKFTPCAADFTNIYDAVEGTVLATKINGFDVFNLGTGKVTTILELANMIISQFKNNLKPKLKEMLPHEALLHCADITKAKKILGFTAKHTIETSVKQYIDWRLKTGERKSAIYR